jgi:hypothetical protein
MSARFGLENELSTRAKRLYIYAEKRILVTMIMKG